MHGLRLTLCLLLLLFPGLPLSAAQIEIVAGAGPSTQIVKVFFAELAQHTKLDDYRFIVPEKSAKHRGGIINADSFLFGRSGRPLEQFELHLGKREIILAEVPVCFAVGRGVPRINMSMEDIRKIFTREITSWREFGGQDAPIELIGRERREVVFHALKKSYPFFKQVTFDRVFHLDNQVIDFIAQEEGKYAITFGAEPNFRAEEILAVDGFDIGIALGLIYDVINEQHPIVLTVKEYAESTTWLERVKSLGLRPKNR